MFKYLQQIFDDAKIYTYNYFNDGDTIKSNKIYPKFSEVNENELSKSHVDDKQLRIDILLFVKQFKNTYYKYTNKSKFNHELYESFVREEHFDGGATAFDDDDEIRIFDRYVLEYIKNRNDVITYLQCKNKEVVIKTKCEDLQDIINVKGTSRQVDILFVIDMPEKELFNYCYGIITEKTSNISMLKSIIFSLICKYKGEYVRMKLNAFTSDKRNHPYLILENFLS